LLFLTFLLRAVRSDQPIVENYVGRQVPTAMVARNLDRGSGFLRPELETGPFPNLFLVEPPVYAAAVVGLKRLTGLGLEPSGRLVSALATVLAAWGLFGLARRREGSDAALLAVAAFAILPLTLRYGRAFQPDALMLGTLVAALRCWDEHEAGRGLGWLVAGVLLLATGLAVKVVAAFVLVPLFACIVRPPRKAKLVLAVLSLVPALLWYVHAVHLLGEGAGSRAAADNGALWLRALGPFALGRPETILLIGRYLVVRAFTPLGFVLAVAGLFWPLGGDRLWRVWGGAALAALALLAGKIHHEYYWLMLAPVAAVGIGRALGGLGARSRVAAGVGLAGLALFQSLSTLRTPPEWATLPEAASAVQAAVPRDAWLVAPEALLFAADRRGGRLETSPTAEQRAAGEWGGTLSVDDPLALVAFYRARGARYVADVTPGTDPRRLALHEAIRRRYNVVMDRDGVLIAVLTERQGAPDGTR
jgi:4-amino-4-deoxy-L-arabinose transferase-like glycosyltransferase